MVQGFRHRDNSTQGLPAFCLIRRGVSTLLSSLVETSRELLPRTVLCSCPGLCSAPAPDCALLRDACGSSTGRRLHGIITRRNGDLEWISLSSSWDFALARRSSRRAAMRGDGVETWLPPEQNNPIQFRLQSKRPYHGDNGSRRLCVSSLSCLRRLSWLFTSGKRPDCTTPERKKANNRRCGGIEAVRCQRDDGDGEWIPLARHPEAPGHGPAPAHRWSE